MSTTQVHIFNRNWMVNGNPINMGTAAQGRALNVRAIQGVIPEYNTNNWDLWAYPNEDWSPSRNNDEFVAQLPNWRDYGLNMVTVGFMGGHPRFQCDTSGESGVPQRNFTSYDLTTGALKADAKTRMLNVISAADAIGMIVNVQLFYQNPAAGQLATNQAYLNALDSAVTWLASLTYTNFIIEVVNEFSDSNYQEAPSLQPANLDERIADVHAIMPDALVSASTGGTGNLPTNIANAVDWVSFHANGLTTSQLRSKINEFCGQSNLNGKPITCTEDGNSVTDLNAAVAEGAGWGFYEQGCEFTGNYTGAARYRDGFQAPPINWSPTSNTSKRNFFERVAVLTGN